jgi:uncharacterized protein
LKLSEADYSSLWAGELSQRIAEQRGRIENDIHTYGQPVLDSEIWQKALRQKHHNYWTVGSHSMSVCVAALRMSYWLEERGIHTDRKRIVRAALCHDLGIIGRDEKYKNNAVCCHRHPIDSIPIAREIYPDIDEETIEDIRWHMWPMCLMPPTNREGFLIILADKYAATGEGLPIDRLERYQKMLNISILSGMQTAR